MFSLIRLDKVLFIYFSIRAEIGRDRILIWASYQEKAPNERNQTYRTIVRTDKRKAGTATQTSS